MRDIGKPAESATLPKTGGAPDFETLRERAAKHGIQIL
jgi:hypothetical protein